MNFNYILDGSAFTCLENWASIDWVDLIFSATLTAIIVALAVKFVTEYQVLIFAKVKG